jgi:uncharacterized membrane protein YhaH (DUF805 family)
VPSRGSRMLSTMNDTFWILILSVVVLFAFFIALGAVTPAETVGVSLGVAALAIVWALHALWASRRHDDRDPRAVRNRERRGF